MKRLCFTFLISIFIFSSAFPQMEIPNGDFELGTDQLDSWELTSGDAQVRNVLVLNGPNGQVTIEPQSGSRMLTLTNAITSLGMIKNIFPVDYRPNYYKFYCGYLSGISSEKFGCGVCLTKYNQNTGINDTILNIMGMLPSNGGQFVPWVEISASLEASYLSDEIPDMAYIYFITDVAQNQYGNIIASPSTVLALDNIRFSNEPTTGTDGFSINNIESHEVYPNPSNGCFTIEYSLLSRTKINLTIYDIQGKEVVSIVDREMERGSHQSVIDLSDLTKGIYIYRLRTELSVKSGKLVVK